MELAARTNWDGMGGGVGGILCVLRGEDEEGWGISIEKNFVSTK